MLNWSVRPRVTAFRFFQCDCPEVQQKANDSVVLVHSWVTRRFQSRIYGSRCRRCRPAVWVQSSARRRRFQLSNVLITDFAACRTAAARRAGPLAPATPASPPPQFRIHHHYVRWTPGPLCGWPQRTAWISFSIQQTQKRDARLGRRGLPVRKYRGIDTEGVVRRHRNFFLTHRWSDVTKICGHSTML